MERREFLKLVTFASLGTFCSFTTTPYQKQTKGIYLTGWKGVGKQSINKTISFMKENDMNTILVDIKNAHGELFFKSENKFAQQFQVQTSEGHLRKLNINHLLEQTKKHNIRLVARHVMFRDEGLFLNKPEWQLHKERNEYWVDMRKQEVIDYNLQLIEEESKMGFDEIALDYIRYPAINKFDGETKRCLVIDDVVKQAKELIGDVDLGVQIFGYSAWHHTKSGVGQRIETLAKHADIIYPMLYPSHFWKGSFGYENPNEHPYEFISMGCKEALKKIKDKTKIIPLLQAFKYEPREIALQIKATKDTKAHGWVLWNSTSKYEQLSTESETK